MVGWASSNGGWEVALLMMTRTIMVVIMMTSECIWTVLHEIFLTSPPVVLPLFGE